MTNDSFKKLYVDELKDLYSAESQLLKALPKMAAAASATELRQGFEKHLKQTEGHVQRLDKIFEALGESPKGKKCVGMEGLVKEGSEVSEEGFEGAVLDAGLIGAAHSSDVHKLILSDDGISLVPMEADATAGPKQKETVGKSITVRQTSIKR